MIEVGLVRSEQFVDLNLSFFICLFHIKKKSIEEYILDSLGS